MDTPRHLGAVPPRTAACEALINRVATVIEPRVELIAEALIDRVTEEMGFDPSDAELREDLVNAARGSVGLLTSMAHRWADPRIVPPPRDALLWARSLVARRLPSHALLRVYRIGQSGYEEVWISELGASGAEPGVIVEAIAAISAFVFTWVDAISAPLLEAYDDELSRRLRGADAVRGESIATALSGGPFDVAAVSARLRYDLDRAHLGLVAWVEHDAPDAAREALEDAAEAVAAVLGDGRLRALVHRDAPGSVLAWVPGGRLDPDVRPQAAEVARTHGIQVACGAPGRGVDGFRSTHETARRARRLARLLRRSARVTVFEEVAMLDLLTRDIDGARALAATTLGPLGEDDDRSLRLLATLRVFFQEGQSFARAARRLDIHENTIADRVRRALQLTGHDPGQDLYALRAAVDLAPLLHGRPPQDLDA